MHFPHQSQQCRAMQINWEWDDPLQSNTVRMAKQTNAMHLNDANRQCVNR